MPTPMLRDALCAPQHEAFTSKAATKPHAEEPRIPVRGVSKHVVRDYPALSLLSLIFAASEASRNMSMSPSRTAPVFDVSTSVRKSLTI